MNETIQTILERRSIRKYTQEAVSPEDLELILQCGLYAACGGNHQETRFIVVTNRSILDDLICLARNEFLKMTPVEGQYKNKAIISAQKRPDSYDFTFRAPALIIVTAPIGWPNGMADSASALQNMQVAAASLGLGACWVNQLHWLTDNSVIREHLTQFGLRSDEDIYGSMVLGHPTVPKPAPLPRKEGRVTIIQ